MKKILVAMMIMIAGFQANAGIMIEPYIGYNLAGEFNNDDTSGVNIGGRLGYSLPMLVSLGIDYNMGEYTHDVSGTDVDVDHSKFGLFVAVDLPILLRAWATYYLNAKAEQGANEYEGSGFGLGVGFTMLPFVSLNLEYRSVNYDDFNGATADIDGTEILLSASIPLDF